MRGLLEGAKWSSPFPPCLTTDSQNPLQETHDLILVQLVFAITGLLEVANFSEEVAAAQLAAQRQCRLEMGLWALKFNHDHMIEIALDTLIGRRLQGLMLAEVHGFAFITNLGNAWQSQA